jgi:O-antigen/teichoic acid export membrane protein
VLGFLAARLLGDSGFGQYSTAFAFVGLFRILPDFGMAYAATLDISRDRSRAQALLGNLLGFQAALSALTLVLCLGIARLLYDGVIWIAVVVLSVDLLLKVLKGTLRWLLKGLERFGAEALSLLTERLAILVFASAALLTGQGVLGFVLAFAALRIVDVAALALWIHARVLPLRPAFDPAAWRALLRKGLPFAYAGLVITLIFQVDAVILEALRGPAEVGWYRAPTLILEGLTLVPRVFGFALIPTMAALYRERPETVTALFARGSKYLLLAGLPVGVFGVLASHQLVPLLFGSGYGASVAAARVLLPAAAFMFLSNFAETTLACVDRWRSILVASTLALALNVALNLAWIPRRGYMGSAYATLATEAAYFLMTAAALARHGHGISWLGVAARPVLASAAFAAVLSTTSGLGLLWSTALAGLTLVAATLALGTFDRAELEALRALGRRP